MRFRERALTAMKAIEFESELMGDTLRVPTAVAEQLTEGCTMRAILLLDEDAGDAAWKTAAYRQFLRDDTAEDAG